MKGSGFPAPTQVRRGPALRPAVWAALLFVLALAPRLPGLRLFLTTDEPTILYAGGSQFLQGLLSGDLSLTYWHFYPGVTMSWLEALGLVVAWLLTSLTGGTQQTLAEFVRAPILELILAARLPYALLTAASVPAFYLLARRVLGHPAALLGALFIAFDPFFLAHSRVAHGDAPVTVFMGLSALAFLVHMQEMYLESRPGTPAAETNRAQGRRGWLILSGSMGGLAALTKAPGPFMALFVVLVGIGHWLLRSLKAGRPDWWLARRWLADLLVWEVVAALLFVTMWPAMWVDPRGTLVRMVDETFGKVEAGHLVFFRGQPVLDPGPWFYPNVIPFRMTPVTLIGALASIILILLMWIGSARDKAEGAGIPKRYVASLLLWVFVISLLLFGNLSPKKQDRYLLPLFPILDLLAAFAFVEMLRIASGALRITHDAIRVAPLLLLLLIHAFPVPSAYPYYLAYFNPLMGGLPRAVEVALVGWGEGMEQVAAYLNQRPEADKLSVAAVPAQTLLPYFRGQGENFYTNDVALRADYVILYVSQVQRLAPSPEIVRYFRAIPPEHSVSVLGVPYAWIYAGPKLITADVPPQATPTNAGFGDRLRLAAYQVTDPGSSSLQIDLFWHALAPLPTDYTVSLRLVGPDGTRLAQHDSWPANGLLPTSQWRPGDYVRDAHLLTLPSGLIPGDYTLQVVVYDATTGAALGEPWTVTSVGWEVLE